MSHSLAWASSPDWAGAAGSWNPPTSAGDLAPGESRVFSWRFALASAGVRAVLATVRPFSCPFVCFLFLFFLLSSLFFILYSLFFILYSFFFILSSFFSFRLSSCFLLLASCYFFLVSSLFYHNSCFFLSFFFIYHVA
jgi:hypothetical protein